MSVIERRFITSEIRLEGQGDEMSLVGYASRFGVVSHPLEGFREMVLPGAFSRSIREGADCLCTINHSNDAVIGRVKNGSLKLSEDGIGLRFRCRLPNTTLARDVHALVKDGYLSECSFAFVPTEQSWEDVKSENGDMYALRKLHSVDLRDVSIVAQPAYPQTSVAASSAPHHNSLPLVEQLFPAGIPLEVRSRFPNIGQDTVARRRRLANSILSI